MIHGRKTPRCPSPTAGRRPDAPAPRQEDADDKLSPTSSADAANRERDAWGDYIDALGDLRRTHSLRDAYLVAVLFGRWLALRRPRT